MLQNADFTNFGLALTEGCHETYVSTATKIGPETFRWIVSGVNDSVVPSVQSSFYQANGFWIDDATYQLRPEVVESYYYDYRATRDIKYQDWAWEAFQAISDVTRVGSGFSEINNVNAVGGGGFKNFQDSFLFAEVLKYAYLVFAEDDMDVPDEIQVQGPGSTQSWVFNTEAHPFRVAGVKV